MSQIHAIVWLDHLNATVIGLSLGKSELLAYARTYFKRVDQLGYG